MKKVALKKILIMSKSFSITESNITNSFEMGKSFKFQGIEYYILNSGKPSPRKGECKTDTYIRAETNKDVQKEFKISIKQKNADFIENKINLDRAIQIFGMNAKKIIINSTKSIKSSFENDYLVTFDKFKRTEAKTLKIGWKFELLNKISGDKSNKMALSEDQILDIYAGTNLDENKKNSMINGEIVKSSGVANFIFFAEIDKKYAIQDIINDMEPIEDYIKDKEIYFACKAINYRVSKDKWDGDRPLSVYVDWSVKNGVLQSEIVFDQPLETKANSIGENIRKLLDKLNIGANNFNELELLLHNTKFFVSNK